MLETQISLSEQEMGIILNLLKQEQDELPVEMRHTRSAEYHTELQDRQSLIRSLIGRLEQRSVNPAA